MHTREVPPKRCQTKMGEEKDPPLSKNKQTNKKNTQQKKKTQKNRLFSVIIKREREKKRDARHHDNNIDNARVSVERRQIESGDARRLRRERGGVDLLQPGSQKSDCQHFYGASSSVTLSCHFPNGTTTTTLSAASSSSRKTFYEAGRENGRGVEGFPRDSRDRDRERKMASKTEKESD